MKATKITKGEATRQRIIECVAPVFNQHGYVGSALSDLMQAANLQKGGIYNHFSGKEELACAAFDHAAGLVRGRITAAIEAGGPTAAGRLHAFAAAFVGFYRDPPVEGGCPILNTATDSDDSHEAASRILRDRTRVAFARLSDTIAAVVRDGITRKEFRPDAQPEQAATIFVSTLEGALLLSRLFDVPDRLDHAYRHLRTYVEQELMAR